MTTPFLVSRPAQVAFSGGRTSAYMLRLILDAHGGSLPADVVPVFTNTGKERPETLDFVRDVGERWRVEVAWVEWRPDPPGFEVVGHNSASRGGEPFDALIAKRRYLPNAVTRFCTQELKINTARRYVRATRNWPAYTSVVGFRADEMRRVNRLCGRNESGKDGWRSVAPLAAAGIVKADVEAFWRAQPFDLKLKPHEGNCDLCFLKNRAKLRELMWDRPDLAEWWVGKERQAREEYGATTGAGFRGPDRPDYAAMFATRGKQLGLDLEEPDPLDLCYCSG